MTSIRSTSSSPPPSRLDPDPGSTAITAPGAGEATPLASGVARVLHPQLRKKTSFIADKLRAQLPAATLGVVAGGSKEESHVPELKKQRSRFGLRNLLAFRGKDATKSTLGAKAGAGAEEVTEPVSIPVSPLKTREALHSAIAVMEGNLAHWDVVDRTPAAEHAKNEIDVHDWKSPQRTHKQRWDDRVEQTKNALSNMRNANFHTNSAAFAYHENDVPVGLMLLTLARNPAQYRTSPGIYVHDIATHPGASGCGGRLIEQAVAVAVGEGQKGLVKLTAENDDAKQAYEKLGFRQSAVSGFHELDPSKSDKWEPVGNTWRLKEQEKPSQ